MPAKAKLILLELNEVNFDIVERYTISSPGQFPALESILSGCRIRTCSELAYEELEPWIQWVSVHTGLSYQEHQVFRLGDVVGSPFTQIFEHLESYGLRIGCISPMNAENRLMNPAYFMPDPWTKTTSDGSWWSRNLSEAVSQAVNDNAKSHISFRSVCVLASGLVRFGKLKHLRRYLKLVINSPGSPWRKALLLDLLLHDIHNSLFQRNQPDFSAVFLNAGAHIQHHYFFNSSVLDDPKSPSNPEWYVATGVDPIEEMLELYDLIVQECLDIPNSEVIIATGLSQKPYDRVKYYYRLRDHAAFLELIGIEVTNVHPRMTRDFLVEFASEENAKYAQEVLESITLVGSDRQLFGMIDNRGDSLFVTLTYSDEITPDQKISLRGLDIKLAPLVAFVAIKNGMHQSDGFAFFTQKVAPSAPHDGSHVKNINDAILSYFEVDPPDKVGVTVAE